MELSDLERSYQCSRAVIAQITDADLERPTPCSEWDVRALLSHYVNAVAMFPAMLAGETPDWGREPEMQDRVAAFDAAVQANLDAWRAPGALDTETPMLPGMQLADLNLLDALVHTWDLARAVEASPDIPDDLATLALERWQHAPLDKSREFGAFGPEVSVPDDAPALHRLLGLVGRDPS